MLKSKPALKRVANFSVVLDYEKDRVEYLKDILPTSIKILKKELRVFEIIDKYPGELGFVLSSNTYDDYVSTYDTLEEDKSKIKPALSKRQFNIVKEHFKDYHD